MSSVWKIGTTEQAYGDATTFAAAGLENLRRELMANGMDAVEFDAPAALALTADISYTYGSSYIIWKDGVRWFYGRVVTIPRQGSDKEETRHVRMEGPWWYFEHATYMQSWKVYDTSGEVLTNVNKCRVVLFQDSDGNRIASGTQVGDVVDWLISRGAPITKGTIDSGITLPYDERVNLRCADVIMTIIRWTPDYVGWFDYSTSPYPTFHFRAKSSLSAVTHALTTDQGRSLQITPRYDLQKPGVYLIYEKTHSVDGYTYNTVTNDIAGNQSAIDCVYGVFDLQGTSRTYVKQKIVTEDYPDEEEEEAFKAWWKARIGWLANVADADFDVYDMSVDSAISSYSRVLKDGMIQDWMSKNAVQGCIRAKVSATIRDSEDAVLEIKADVDVSVEVTATDASTRTYTRLSSFDAGEETPTGVAAALYNSWSVLHFEGSLIKEEQECSGTLLPGKTLNISGGRSEWTSMAAIVQRVSEDVDSGTTTIFFGPPAQVEADSLVALFRALRSRRYSWQASTRSTGVSGGSGEVEISGRTKDTSQSSGGGKHERLLVVKGNEDGDHTIDLDPSAVAHADAGDDNDRTLKPREVWIPQLNGATPEDQLVYKLRQVLCSDAYHADQLVGALIRLKELLDVDITSLADGDGLTWDDTAGKWVNGPVSTEDPVAEDPDTEIDTLGSSTEGSETAATDTWTAGNVDDHGLALWLVGRVVYSETGDKKIYAFLRKATFDKKGMLYSVSGETRVEVDAAVAYS